MSFFKKKLDIISLIIFALFQTGIFNYGIVQAKVRSEVNINNININFAEGWALDLIYDSLINLGFTSEESWDMIYNDGSLIIKNDRAYTSCFPSSPKPVHIVQK